MNLKEFVNPPKHCRPCPVWSWNYLMEAAEIENRIRDMKKKGFGGFFIQARPGLRTEYLGDDWMRAVRRAVETARDTELECWLHDEDTWPSGFGACAVTADNDNACAMALTWAPDASSLGSGELDSALAYTRKREDGSIELTREKPDDPSGFGVFFTRRITGGDARFHGGAYPDLLDPGTVQAFIDAVHEKYSKLFRYDFGEYMPGICTTGPTVARGEDITGDDERGFRSFPWSAGFEDFFEAMHGYSPIDSLHFLLDAADDGGFSFRHDYRLAVNERFLRSYTIPLASWCREHDLLFTGRFADERSPFGMIASGGTVMSHDEYLDVPAAGCPGRGAPDLLAVRQAASVANQLGRKRVLCELFKGAGHDLSFEDMKLIADACLAAGATFLKPHLVSFSLKGDRKRDFPPTLSYHQPFWEHIRVINDYLGRASWSTGMGRSTARVLVMVPADTAYGAASPGNEASDGRPSEVEGRFRALIGELETEHIAFDLGDERIVARHGIAEGAVFMVGRSEYDLVVLPESATWRSSTLDLLDSFEGSVVMIGDPPGLVDGRENSRLVDFARGEAVSRADGHAAAAALIAEKAGRDVTVVDENGERARSVLVNHRAEAGAHLLFLANTDRERSLDVTVTVKALGGVVELDPLTGRAYRYASVIRDGATEIRTRLHHAGSRIFLIDQTQTSVEDVERNLTEETLVIDGPYSFQRLHDNVLVIDRCRLDIDGRTVFENGSLLRAKEEIWKATGIDEYRGCQPWIIEKRNVRTRTNQTRLTFSFTVEDVPETLDLAMESGDRFTVRINGNEVEPTPGKWHLDKRFTAYAIGGHLVQGENVVTADTDFLWDTEIENIYLYGDFAVGPQSEGFPVRCERELIEVGDWAGQGYPFYPGSLTYKMEFDLEFDESERFELDLSGAKGTSLYVTVNGTEVGSVPLPPFRAEITGALKQGTNTLEVEVIGSLRNTLGPLRIADGRNPDIISPESFGDDLNGDETLHFVPYGFLEAPKLVRIGGAGDMESAVSPDEQTTVNGESEAVEKADDDGSGETAVEPEEKGE